MISKWKVSAIVSGLLFLLFSPFHNVSFAESYSLSGSVKDSSGNAIPNSAVSVNDASSASTVTDSTGAYNLTIEEGSYKIYRLQHLLAVAIPRQ